MLNNSLLIYIKNRIDETRFFYALTLLELTLYVYRSIVMMRKHYEYYKVISWIACYC